jgi:hypothetical protein
VSPAAFTLNYIKWRLGASAGWTVAAVIVSSPLLRAIFAWLPDAQTDSPSCALPSILTPSSTGRVEEAVEVQRARKRMGLLNRTDASFLPCTNIHRGSSMWTFLQPGRALSWGEVSLLKNDEVQNGSRRDLKQGHGPSEQGALCSCTGWASLK